MRRIATFSLIILLLLSAYSSAQLIQVSFPRVDAVNSWTDNPTGTTITASMITVRIWESREDSRYTRLLDEGKRDREKLDRTGGIINRDDTFQIRQDTVAVVESLVGQLNTKYDELITILGHIDTTRGLINTYLAEVDAGQHQDKSHPGHMDTLAYWKEQKWIKEGEIGYLKDQANTAVGYGLPGWWVVVDTGGGGGGGGGN